MAWFLCPRQAAGGVLALEAFRFVRACFRIRRSPFGRALVDLHGALSVFEAMDVDNRACDRGASSRGPRFFVRVLSSCALVRVSLADTLDSSPRVSIRALALG